MSFSKEIETGNSQNRKTSKTIKLSYELLNPFNGMGITVYDSRGIESNESVVKDITYIVAIYIVLFK